MYIQSSHAKFYISVKTYAHINRIVYEMTGRCAEHNQLEHASTKEV